jgi:hypothetical protein
MPVRQQSNAGRRFFDARRSHRGGIPTYAGRNLPSVAFPAGTDDEAQRMRKSDE